MICALIITMTSTAVYAASWDYSDPDTKWPISYPLCGGSTQSPIDIDPLTVDSNTFSSTTLDWELEDDISTFEIVNNGHSIKMTPIADSSASNDAFGVLQNIDAVGSEHSEYCLHSAHIHWGGDNGEGSEHEIDGEQYVMEMHFVHYSCDYDSITEALNASPTDSYVLAVVGVLFEIGSQNDFIEKVVDRITDIDDSHVAIQITNADITDTVPTDSNGDFGKFYYYKGSLTTPPCSPVGMQSEYISVCNLCNPHLLYSIEPQIYSNSANFVYTVYGR